LTPLIPSFYPSIYLFRSLIHPLSPLFIPSAFYFPSLSLSSFPPLVFFYKRPMIVRFYRKLNRREKVTWTLWLLQILKFFHNFLCIGSSFIAERLAIRTLTSKYTSGYCSM
jgi:hypothetical protein